MITYGFQYDVKPEYRDEFLEISNKALSLMKTLDGHVMTKLLEDVNKTNSFMIYSEWNDNEAFKQFMKSQEFKDVQTASADMLASQPSHKMFKSAGL